MTVLALDLGNTTGWAVGNGNGGPAFGTWAVQPRRGESPGFRYIRLRAELEKVREAFPDLALVVYEAAHHRGGAATEVAVGCATTVQSWCAEKGIEHASVHTGRLKKWATGRGNASKELMSVAAVVRAVPGVRRGRAGGRPGWQAEPGCQWWYRTPVWRGLTDARTS